MSGENEGMAPPPEPYRPSAELRRRWLITDLAREIYIREGAQDTGAIPRAKAFYDALDAALGPEPKE